MKWRQESGPAYHKKPQKNERLEKVRSLLKPASMMTAALEIRGAAELMGRLRENLEEAERLLHEGGTPEEMDAPLDAAVACVQTLHLEIIQHAYAIAQDSQVISLYPLLDADHPNPVAEIESLATFQESTVGPFLQSLLAVYSLSETLSARSKTILGELMESQLFAPGDEGGGLHSTTTKVNSLLSTVAAQQYVEQVAKGLVAGSLSGLKVTMLAERETKRARLELALDVVRMHLKQSQMALQNTSDDWKGGASAKKKRAILRGIDKAIQGVSSKVSELSARTRNLRESQTLRDIFAICCASEEVEDEASGELEKLLEVLTEFEPRVENLNEVGKQDMEELADKYREYFARKHQVTQRAYYGVQERVENIIEKGKFPSATTMQRHHGSVAQSILEIVNQTVKKSEEEMTFAASALRELKSVDKLSTATVVLEGLKVMANSLVRLKEEALLQLLSLHLVNILQHDIEHMAMQEAALASDPDYPHVEQQKMHLLQSKFKAAKGKAESAGTLQEMTAAAIAMRTFHAQMEGLLYEQRRER
ncbi:hypothetical protein, conserved [Eimeria acervulina]|uniref:Uncharacterized protein n=1 Tax=Eimeria acervulina TaxID=5801 RepID=U6GPH2_EIMAC|nr:hypothetical protein, conserved [Eimeria acervulina]CDI81168.1 hypothetical protein, conserved [Eimeria acervulina]